MANNRSEYIQQLIADKESISEAMANVAKDTMRSLLDESVQKGIRQFISESDDDFKEDETDDPTLDKKEEPKETETDVDVKVDDTVEGDEESTSMETDDTLEAGDDDIWGEIDNVKGEDGAYDCTGMDQEKLVKVFRELSPEDNVTVIPMGDGKIELTDQETDKTYIIDTDVEPVTEGKDDTGYTDNYQNQTAMTTPDNHEPADSKTTYSMDGGVPTGTEKPFAGKGDKGPFTQEVSESDETFEVELEDSATERNVEEGAKTVSRHAASTHGVTMSAPQNSDSPTQGRNSHIEGEQVHGTSENPYSTNESMEKRLKSISAKANAIFNENKKLHQVLGTLTNRLQEAVVLNKSMGNIIRLMNEHSTTRDEKKAIITRFGNAKTIEESNSLFATISEELKRRPAPQIETQVSITESVNKSNTATSMYKSNEMTDFMARLNKIKNR